MKALMMQAAIMMGGGDGGGDGGDGGDDHDNSDGHGDGDGDGDRDVGMTMVSGNGRSKGKTVGGRSKKPPSQRYREKKKKKLGGSGRSSPKELSIFPSSTTAVVRHHREAIRIFHRVRTQNGNPAQPLHCCISAPTPEREGYLDKKHHIQAFRMQNIIHRGSADAGTWRPPRPPSGVEEVTQLSIKRHIDMPNGKSGGRRVVKNRGTIALRGSWRVNPQ